MKYLNIKAFKLSHTIIAKAFGFKTVKSFRCSSAHRRYMKGIEEILTIVKNQSQNLINANMDIHFIKVTKNECNDHLCNAEMQTVPRIGESITFPVAEGGKTYRIVNVDYLVIDKKQGWIRVWVEECK